MKHLLISMVMVLALAGPALAQKPAEQTATIKVTLRGVDEKVYIVPHEDGSLQFVLHTEDGEVSLTPEDFAQRVHAEQTDRPWIMAVLNVTDNTGVIWVMLGLVGQALFAGRLIVQWLASEKSKRSVVPPAFWWMALAGASMVLVYGIWRNDIVIIIGQCTGWTIYVRNLYFIYIKHKDQPIVDEELEPADA